jgi:hypothetical protein
MSGPANDCTRLFTSLTFVYAVIQYLVEKRNGTGYVRLVDESCGEDPDYVIPGQHEEKGWEGLANPVS